MVRRVVALRHTALYLFLQQVVHAAQPPLAGRQVLGGSRGVRHGRRGVHVGWGMKGDA